MLNVALTGNIAAGKSAVAELFRRWGATLIDADRLAREAQRPGSEVLQAIAARFGQDLILSDGQLDRAALRGKVMADDAALSALNAIVHPAVRRRRDLLHTEAASRGDLIVINDIPLLFEAADPAAFDLVVLVDAPLAVRRQRLVELRHLSTEDADRMLEAQLPAPEKRARSDFIIDNDADLSTLKRQVHAVWRALRAAAARRALEAGVRTLLVVVAHPDDASFGPAGTIARYADAGVEVHLVCATTGEAGLRRAAEILGLASVRLLGQPDNKLHADSATGIALVAHLIQQTGADAIISFGPDGVTGHRDHLAVHAWSREGWRRTKSGLPLLYYGVLRGSREQQSTPGIAGVPAEALPVRLDVRPWLDVKVAAIRAHESEQHSMDLDDPDVVASLGEERFAEQSETPVAPRATLTDPARVNAQSAPRQRA